MKILCVFLACLLEMCRGMGAGEYCFSCDAGTNHGSDGQCDDEYIPPQAITISPNICDDISNNVTEEHRLCKRYPKGYIFRCYTEADGNFFNCKSSCTVPLEDVGKSIGIQDNLSKVMNHGLLAGFGNDSGEHKDLLSDLDLNMFNADGNNPHRLTGSGVPKLLSSKKGVNPGPQQVNHRHAIPGAPSGAFDVNKPLTLQNNFQQYNARPFSEKQGNRYPVQNPPGVGYGYPNQYANPYAGFIPTPQNPAQGNGHYPQNAINQKNPNDVPTPSQQINYPSHTSDTHSNTGNVKSPYVSQVPQNYVPSNQENIQGVNRYNNGLNNQGFGNMFQNHGRDYNKKFSRSMQGSQSNTGSGLKDLSSFNNAASTFGGHNFGENSKEFDKQNGAFHGFPSNADNGNFGLGQHGDREFGNRKIFDLLNSNMDKKYSLRNQKLSGGNIQDSESRLGQSTSNSKNNVFATSSKSSSGKNSGSSFGVFDRKGLNDVHQGMGLHNGVGNYDHNQAFDNFFRQPVRKAGATTRQKESGINFNFGNLDNFMNEVFHHNQGALQGMFSDNPFVNQGYRKLFPSHNTFSASDNGGAGKNNKHEKAGKLHTEYGRFFDFV